MVYIAGKAEHPVWKVLRVLLVIVILLAIAGAWFYTHPDQWKKLVKDTPLQPPPTVTTTYKWRDAKGNWQVSDRPPPGDIPYEVLIFNSDTNIVPSLQTGDGQ